MALHRSFCVFLVATLYGVCQAQCVIRTLMPVTMLDACTGTCGFSIEEPQSQSCCADDLSTLLMLARALEMDKAASANNGIDVNGLLNTLIHGLVYIATHNCGNCYDCHHGGHPTTGSPPGSGNNHPPTTGSPPGSGNNHPPTTGSPPGSGNNHPTHGKKDKEDPLINLNLLGATKPNVADLDIAGTGVLDLGLGDTSKGKSGGVVSGLLGGLL